MFIALASGLDSQSLPLTKKTLVRLFNRAFNETDSGKSPPPCQAVFFEIEIIVCGYRNNCIQGFNLSVHFSTYSYSDISNIGETLAIIPIMSIGKI
jgi:hypothetical protein